MKQEFSLQGVDKKDLAILRELDRNVRASAAKIGRRTRLSKEVVQYRIKRLEEEKIIAGYWGLILTGAPYAYKILIKNRSLSGEKKHAFVEFVLSQACVSWFASTEGNWDYVLTLFGQQDKDVIAFADALFTRFGTHFQEKQILKMISSSITNDKYLVQGRFLYTIENTFYEFTETANATQYRILRELSLNSRQSFTQIGRTLKLTPEAIAYQYKSLVKKKFIVGLKVRLNFEKLGLSYYHLFIALQHQERKKDIISYYIAHPHCNSVLHHVGFYDMHLEFILPLQRIQEVMDDLLAKFGNDIASYELLKIREEYTLHTIR